MRLSKRTYYEKIMKKLAFAYAFNGANGFSWLFGSSSEPEVVPAVIPVSDFRSLSF